MQRTCLEPSQILVFLGPTLPIAQASQILPARYLAPARCGDILAYLRLQPRVIAIIDGVFDRSAAVWHKEILWAMAEGVAVWGASSMGALRAAELEVFGMQGVGAVFAAYRDGVYVDDDEVAVSHGNAASQFRALTDAMVNLRSTVAAALSQAVIDAPTADLVLTCAKQRFYAQRHLSQAIADAEQQGGERVSLNRLRQFVQTGGYIDQKQLDAIALLQQLAQGAIEEPEPLPRKAFKLSKTIYLEELQANVALRPLRSPYDWLPWVEKISQAARCLGRPYVQLRNLAGLIRWCDFLAQRQGIQPGERDVAAVLGTDLFGLGTAASADVWAAQQDLSAAEMQTFVVRLGRIQALLRQQAGDSGFAEQVESCLKNVWLLNPIALSEESADAEDDRTLPLERLYRQVATLWALVEQCDRQPDIALRTSTVQQITQRFLQERGLVNDAALQAWLTTHNLNQTTFTELMIALTRLTGYVNVPRWWGRGLSDYFPITTCFLPDALRLSGFYLPLKQRVKQQAAGKIQPLPRQDWPAYLKRWCEQQEFPAHCDLEQLAFWFDFSDSEALVQELSLAWGHPQP